jgi:hypothetical protein
VAMSNVMAGIIILFSLLWFYSFTSVINNEFKNKSTKQLWIFAITLVPVLAFFYIFIEEDLIKEKTTKK